MGACHVVLRGVHSEQTHETAGRGARPQAQRYLQKKKGIIMQSPPRQLCEQRCSPQTPDPYPPTRHHSMQKPGAWALCRGRATDKGVQAGRTLKKGSCRWLAGLLLPRGKAKELHWVLIGTCRKPDLKQSRHRPHSTAAGRLLSRKQHPAGSMSC